jgi:hypothetical protein
MDQMTETETISLSELSKKIGLDETIKIAVDQLGMTESDARFAIAVGLGELDGDVIEVEEEES